ncbi:CS-domain-containing protein [Nadsonia fulvescens var. elongata DSM 6958]|uniref:Nuclear movement protein nudC n=1 Tax=Nadsonia fulvescens var. elongata DSM 6958 TaxID=857566 RepID=A0A1E3PMH9_9ASCO|nr:CS-domain-containing protein [Nadsonia fulvescens var. elongata DSM 6958]
MADVKSDLPYTWNQTLQEVTITIPIPEGSRPKDLNVSIQKSKILVAVKGSDPVLTGDLFALVSTDESTWTIVDKKELVITLEKINSAEWWPHVVTSAPRIDVTKIEPENSKLSDLDGETRATVEKMMFDQRQKQMGLPSSEELKKQEIFKRFQSQHPEMDFSKVKMDFSS